MTFAHATKHVSIEQIPLSPADQVRYLHTLIERLPVPQTRALLQAARWQVTERTSHHPMVLGSVRDILAGHYGQSVRQWRTSHSLALARIENAKPKP